MSIVYPENRKEVVDRIATDVQNEIKELTPQLRNSIIRALIIGFGGRFFDIYTQQQQAQRELFPDTATLLVFIQRWGLLKGIDINPASQANGLITTSGTQGSIIDEGTIFKNEADNEYEAINQNYTIADVTYGINVLTRSGTTATAVLSVDHNLASGISVTISGAVEVEYNITAVITVISENSFTYEVAGSPATPATGVIVADATIASIEVRSIESGVIQNLDSGAKLTVETPIAGVDDNSFVQFTKISGGTDEETNDAYRTRVLEAYANPISNFNDADIIEISKTVPGVTRVWVFDATPQAGEIEVYFVRDNDEGSILPDANEIQTVKDKILTIKTAPMLDADVRVFAPTPVIVDFVFSSLVPDSQSLRDEIEKSLAQAFADIPQVGVNLSEDAYRSAIFTTRDPETGEPVTSFALTIPSGDIAVGQGNLAVLGTITF